MTVKTPLNPFSKQALIDYFWEKEWIKRPKSALFSKQALKLFVVSSKSKLLYIVTVIFLFLIKPWDYGFRVYKCLILKALKFVKYCGENVFLFVKNLFLWSNSLVSGSGNLRPEICEIIPGSFQAKTTKYIMCTDFLFVYVVPLRYRPAKINYHGLDFLLQTSFHHSV